MPRSAIDIVPQLDYMLPAGQMGPLLAKLSAESVTVAEASPANDNLNAEVAMAALEGDQLHADEHPGVPSGYACPDCHGALYEIHEGRSIRFRCRTGHGYTLAALEQEQGVQVDGALWNAFRSLEEYASLLTFLAARSQPSGAAQSAAWREQSGKIRDQAESLRRIIENSSGNGANRGGANRDSTAKQEEETA